LKDLARKQAAARDMEALSSPHTAGLSADRAQPNFDEESSAPCDGGQSTDPPPALVESTVEGRDAKLHAVVPDAQHEAELPVVSQSCGPLEQLMSRNKPPASVSKRFPFQRGPEPSVRTLYRRAEQSKARTKAAENVRKIDTFFKPA
jgi:hypothetical protein